MEELSAVGLSVPEILLPARGIDLARWAVVACDQYTSEPEYWKACEERVGAAPSTLRLILPEVWLGAADEGARVTAIQATMREYLARGVFAPPQRGLVVVDRATPHVRSRLGLLVALDLERYDWRRGSKALVRATEATVEERLPPRMRVRRGAEVELPHVLVLIDDPRRTVIEPLAERARTRAPLYDTTLEPASGRVRGFGVTEPDEIAGAARALAALAQGTDPFLYAVGDGNHSLAAAKQVWEERKRSLSEAERAGDPARFALVELVNLHDPGLRFEPIHRLVFGARPESLAAELAALAPQGPIAHRVTWLAAGRTGEALLRGPRDSLALAVFQDALDRWLAAHPSARIDYIHGDDTLARLAAAPDRVGFRMAAFPREAVFPAVARDGALPRKTFSLGDAEEKRFYLEARRIHAAP
jgi:Protein of unknown function (DUF1015)